MNCLMYHRIAHTATNPWGIAVSPEMFETQIAWLVEHREVITSEELVNRLRSGRVDANSTLVSFDDGYVDNFLVARPILEKYHCPATFFIPTFFTGRDEPFWWDELESIFLTTERLPSVLNLEIGGKKDQFFLNPKPLTETEQEKLQHWRWDEKEPSGRGEVFLALWKRLKELPVPAIRDQIGRIREWSDVKPGMERPCPMTAAELKWLSANPLFSIGLHTHTHPDLSQLKKGDQMEEIRLGMKMLERDFSIRSRILAYPFGSYDQSTLEAVQEIGLDACFTTEPVEIFPGSDPYRLGRFQAENKALPLF